MPLSRNVNWSLDGVWFGSGNCAVAGGTATKNATSATRAVAIRATEANVRLRTARCLVDRDGDGHATDAAVRVDDEDGGRLAGSGELPDPAVLEPVRVTARGVRHPGAHVGLLGAHADPGARALRRARRVEVDDLRRGLRAVVAHADAAVAVDAHAAEDRVLDDLARRR